MLEWPGDKMIDRAAPLPHRVREGAAAQSLQAVRGCGRQDPGGSWPRWLHLLTCGTGGTASPAPGTCSRQRERVVAEVGEDVAGAAGGRAGFAEGGAPSGGSFLDLRAGSGVVCPACAAAGL